MYTGILKSGKKVLKFGSYNEKGRNSPAFGIYKGKNNILFFALGFDDKKLREEVGDDLTQKRFLLRDLNMPEGFNAFLDYLNSLYTNFEFINQRMDGKNQCVINEKIIHYDDGGEWMDDVAAQVKRRRGQANFRNSLLQLYNETCLVTGCKIASLLEAAHIRPHSESIDYSISNGLLLRADIHRLFDSNLLGIDENGQVHISYKVNDEYYCELNGRKTNLLQINEDSLVNLRNRFDDFAG